MERATALRGGGGMAHSVTDSGRGKRHARMDSLTAFSPARLAVAWRAARGELGLIVAMLVVAGGVPP